VKHPVTNQRKNPDFRYACLLHISILISRILSQILSRVNQSIRMNRAVKAESNTISDSDLASHCVLKITCNTECFSQVVHGML